MASFADAITTELNGMDNKTRTENGALAYSTTGNACLDLFATIGALRARSDEEIIELFKNAYDENALLALKILFYSRDIREGLGERRTFRVIIKWLAQVHPEAVIENIRLFGVYGRYDDLYALMNTPLEDDMWKYVSQQLDDDIYNAKADKPISLLAKWLRTPGVSSKKTSELGHKTARALGYTDKDFKRVIRNLRKHIGIVETQMSRNEWNEIDYSKVPGRAMHVHSHAFTTHDHERFIGYVDAAASGKTAMHADTLYPYDIVKKILRDNYHWSWSWHSDENRDENADANKVSIAEWNNMPDYLNGAKANAIVIADVSGSMTYPDFQPLASSIGLAMYFAQRNSGPYHGLWMDFSDSSNFHALDENKSIVQNVLDMVDGPWGHSTNLEDAFKHILDLAVQNAVPADEMPKSLIVISDMEINMPSEGSWKMILDEMQAEYADHGYQLPVIVLWNANSRHDVFHADAEHAGVLFCSGSSASTFKNIIGSIGKTPVQMMLDTVNVPRYDCVKIAEALD